jgi:hypothetical protein
MPCAPSPRRSPASPSTRSASLPDGARQVSERRRLRRAARRAAPQSRAFARGETRKLTGIGVSFFTEIVDAGPIKNCDILGLGMFDSC